MLSVEHVCFGYGRRGPAVLDDVSLSLDAGQIGILLGPNGSGKTTLLKIILGLLTPRAGAVRFEGEDFLRLPRRERARRIAYVPQEIRFGALSVFDSVLMGRVAYFGLRAGAEDRRVVARVLADMGLEPLAGRSVQALSGGERQKIAIARAMAQQPRLLIFDEPTGNLDIANEQLILEEARKLAREKGVAILSTLHDLNQAMAFGDRFFFLRDGAIRRAGGPEAFTPRAIRETFGIVTRIVEVEGRRIVIGERGVNEY